MAAVCCPPPWCFNGLAAGATGWLNVGAGLVDTGLCLLTEKTEGAPTRVNTHVNKTKCLLPLLLQIFRLDTEAGTRSTASGTLYNEDLQYSRTLDEGWDLGTVRRVAQQTLDALPSAIAWLDDGSEHPHRVALRCGIRGWLLQAAFACTSALLPCDGCSQVA